MLHLQLSIYGVVLEKHGVSSQFHLVRLLFTWIIYPDMCRKTESQVWSAAESSPGYSEMQNYSDNKMKVQCFVIFMGCRLLVVIPHKGNILPHSKTT